MNLKHEAEGPPFKGRKCVLLCHIEWHWKHRGPRPLLELLCNVCEVHTLPIDEHGTAGGNGQVESAYPYWAKGRVQIHLSEGHVIDDVRVQKGCPKR
ncbi:hypothetical protein RIF29_27878 [Crotalaria pallida]|uniref:Uncharacterized protein n=1 Tax=Crotalaria pallida TaxID=3830 RepID=A0AAN9I1F5_CROPI